MNPKVLPGLALLIPMLAAGADETGSPAQPSAPPTEWIDAETGHRVIRLSEQPGSSSFYFHDNAYTPEGDKLIFNTRSGIACVDLTTLGVKPPRVEIVVSNATAMAMARTTREVYFVRNNASFAAHLDTHAIREVARGRFTVINCDETIGARTVNAPDPTGKTPRPEPRTMLAQRQRMFGEKLKANIPLTPEEEAAARKEDGLARRLNNPNSQAFVFTHLKTGEATTNGYQYASLNHLQFSPTDPNLLLYCHEGTWHEVDRIWTIRTDGTEQRLRHKREMDMEIAGHEFWSYDGKNIWFDLQTPRSQEFWLAGVNLETGKEIRYRLERDWWSIHYNVSRDGKLFAGDGGDPGQVAFAKDGQWINLFRPQPDGTMLRERLVNMSKHNYVTGRGGVEPNVTITPDGKWVVFKSNMFGPQHVFAVEIDKTNTNQQVYPARGVIREFDPDGKTVKIRHDEILGYMPAMTMPFEVRDTNELAGLKPGDTVSFRMIVTADAGWIDQVKKLDATPKADAPMTGPIRLVQDVHPLKAGDALPDYSFTNELGQTVSLSQFRGQALAITFLFTRCPYPDFCPRMANNFEKAQQQLLALASGPTNWHLLTISFDPDFDTPARLKTYAEQHHYDPRHSTFATGKLGDIAALTGHFGMFFWRDDTGGISHNLRTVVVDSRGRVQDIIPENKWTPDELVAEMVKAAKAGP